MIKRFNKILALKLKTLVPVILAACLLFVCVLAYGKIAYGWFSQNKVVEANSFQVSLKAINGIDLGEYYIFKRTGAEEGALNVTNENSIVMTEFDTVFTDKNVNTPIIVKICIKQYPSDLSDICINLFSEDNFLDSDNKIGNYLSNLIRVSAMVGNPTLDAYDEDEEPESIYSEVTSYFKNKENNFDSNTFVSVTYDEENRSYSINEKKYAFSLVISGYESAISNGELCIYLDFNYDLDLVETYIQEHGIEVGSFNDDGSSDIVNFQCDIKELIFSKTPIGGEGNE